jgi:hypothetical protein
MLDCPRPFVSGFYYLPPALRAGYNTSEACFADAGDLSLIGEFAEADTADAVVAEIRMRTTADLAAVVSASGELSRSLLFKDH